MNEKERLEVEKICKRLEAAYDSQGQHSNGLWEVAKVARAMSLEVDKQAVSRFCYELLSWSRAHNVSQAAIVELLERCAHESANLANLPPLLRALAAAAVKELK